LPPDDLQRARSITKGVSDKILAKNPEMKLIYDAISAT
jgi:hypothetical protein